MVWAGAQVFVFWTYFGLVSERTPSVEVRGSDEHETEIAFDGRLVVA